MVPIREDGDDGKSTSGRSGAYSAMMMLVVGIGKVCSCKLCKAKCNEALGVFMPPVRGKFKGKRQTLKSLCKHQCAFHMVYGADASPTALDGPSEEWFEQKEGEDYLRPKIVFEDKSDIESGL